MSNKLDSAASTPKATCRPIHLRPWEISALLAGRKSVIRRPLKEQPPEGARVRSGPNKDGRVGVWWSTLAPELEGSLLRLRSNPWGRAGDELVGKETWAMQHGHKDHTGRDPDMIWYRADGMARYLKDAVRFSDLNAREFSDDEPWLAGVQEAEAEVQTFCERWSSPATMPAALSRLRLRLTADPIVQRLGDVTPSQAALDGFPRHVVEHTFRKCYRGEEERAAKRVEYLRLEWDRDFGKQGYPAASSPWTWVGAVEVLRAIGRGYQ